MNSKMKPILFSTPMVQAILDGRKTMTRRVIKSKHESGLFRVSKRVSDGLVTEITSLDWDERPKNDCTNDIQPKYKSGDILWVRETWARATDIPEFDPISGLEDYSDLFIYRADFNNGPVDWNWKPSIFMPRQACRIFLEVTDVRAEKLRAISEQDAISEGIMPVPSFNSGAGISSRQMYNNYLKEGYTELLPIDSFKSLWQSINGDWNPDQWVWVYSFKSIDQPE